MNERAEKYEAFLDDLALVVDGDAEALERHADFLVDDDEARDLRHEAADVVAQIEGSGADYAHPEDFVARLMVALDEDEGGVGGDADADADEDEDDDAEIDSGRTTNPGFAALDLPKTVELEETSVEAVVAESAEPEPTEAPADETDARPKRKMGKLLAFPIAGALALAAAAAVGLVIWSSQGDDATTDGPVAASGIEATVAHIDRAADDGESGLSVQRPGSDAFVAIGADEAIPAGATVRTDDRTRALLRMSDGSELTLDHATALALRTDEPRGLSLTEGNLVADIAHLDDGPNATFQTATGSVEVLGTEFELSANEDLTSVRVSRGVVSVSGAGGQTTLVNAGEEGVVRAGDAPSVAPFTDLARRMAWSELGGPTEGDADDADTLAGIGSLRARRPGERQAQERPLHLARHSVRVRIVGNVARTEIEEVFRNDSDHTLEGVYRFPLPPDAQIARLALDVEGRMEEGSFVERDRAAAIWRGVIRNATPTHQRADDEEFVWVPGPWHDPAILEWQRGGQFELRIFPIPAHGERRVILSYTQTVDPQGGRRQYTYPLAHSADDSTRVGQFDLDVRVAGAEHVEASGYRVTEADGDGATELTMTERDFTPKGDLTIEYQLPGGERELRWWTYQGESVTAPPETSRERDREVIQLQRELAEDERPYVAFALRPDLPRAAQRRERDYVLVVDASQSMFGERYDRASRLATTVVREMDRRDRFTVLACDYQCRAMPGGLQPPTAEAAEQAQAWLEEIEPAGASDLTAVLREAAATVSAERRDDRELHLMYVGDGTSSVGYRRAASLAAEAEALAEAERVAVTTVGVGGDADTTALGAIARATGGHYVPYVPGQRISTAAMAVLETTYGASLESPAIELPDGLSQTAPSELPTIRAGQELIVVGRMDQPNVNGEVVLRGTVAGRPFERRYEVSLTPTDAAGNRFVPRLWAAGRIDEMQLSGRGEDRARIIAMSKGYGVLSRHTSLLVLESEAMFRAFRVDRNTSPAAQWTGEEDVVAGGAAGEDVAGGGGVGRGGLGLLGAGRGGGGMASGSAGRGPQPARQRRARSSATAQARPSLDDSDMDMFGGSGRADRESSAGEAMNPWSRDSTATPPAEPQPLARPMPTRRRRPGRWMQRVRVRTAEVRGDRDVTEAERRRADEAEEALEENPDSRDRHREAVQRLARAGRLERALEVAEAWIVRDREDPEALTAKADLLGRLGRRDEALRLLTGTVDLRPDSGPLHERLASAFDRAERPERACAHRIALAEIGDDDPSAVAAAMRCERSLGRDDAAQRILYSVREGRVRTRAERLADDEPRERGFRGDFTVEGEWSGGDLDLSIVTSHGTRLSWMGGRTTLVGDRVDESGRERLGLRWTAPGLYRIEISRTDPDDTSEIRGQLRIRVLGERQTVPFTLSSERQTVARVRVRRETRLVPMTGSLPR